MSGSEVVMDKSLGVIADSGSAAHVVPHLRHLTCITMSSGICCTSRVYQELHHILFDS